jgi:hypothetical protein
MFVCSCQCYKHYFSFRFRFGPEYIIGGHDDLYELAYQISMFGLLTVLNIRKSSLRAFRISSQDLHTKSSIK